MDFKKFENYPDPGSLTEEQFNRFVKYVAIGPIPQGGACPVCGGYDFDVWSYYDSWSGSASFGGMGLCTMDDEILNRWRTRRDVISFEICLNCETAFT